jgi:hypothetical protein
MFRKPDEQPSVAHFFDENSEDFQRSLFILLVMEGKISEAIALLEKYPQFVNATRMDGKHVLFLALEHPQGEPLAIRLIQMGASLDIKGDGGNTPLMAAVVANFINAGECLLQKGVNIDAINEFANATALHIAAVMGRKVFVDLLLKYNPKLTLKNKNGLAAMQLATRERINAVLPDRIRIYAAIEQTLTLFHIGRVQDEYRKVTLLYKEETSKTATLSNALARAESDKKSLQEEVSRLKAQNEQLQQANRTMETTRASQPKRKKSDEVPQELEVANETLKKYKEDLEEKEAKINELDELCQRQADYYNHALAINSNLTIQNTVLSTDSERKNQANLSLMHENHKLAHLYTSLQAEHQQLSRAYQEARLENAALTLVSTDQSGPRHMYMTTPAPWNPTGSDPKGSDQSAASKHHPLTM